MTLLSTSLLLSAESNGSSALRPSSRFESSVTSGIIGTDAVRTKEVCSWLPVGSARAIDRTTSPLQIGQVRRRVVSQGVLRLPVSLESQMGLWRRLTCTPHGIHARTEGSSLDSDHRHTLPNIPHTRPDVQCTFVSIDQIQKTSLL